jgi:hypothetical protein
LTARDCDSWASVADEDPLDAEIPEDAKLSDAMSALYSRCVLVPKDDDAEFREESGNRKASSKKPRIGEVDITGSGRDTFATRGEAGGTEL